MLKLTKILFITSLIVSIFVITCSAYQEAPMLKEEVEKGELPPVEKRLPEDPLVLPVRDEIGEFGGTIVTADTRVPPVKGYNVGNFSGQTLVFYAWGLRGDKGEIVPNIAKDFEVNENFTEFTFYLRKGLKWSDGHPYTAEDLDFYWNHVLKNEELTPSKPDIFKDEEAEDGLMEFEILDEYTVRFKSKIKKPWFLHQMASVWHGGPFCRHPKHYMKQFHIDFVDKEKLEELVKEKEFDEWFQLYGDKVGSHKPESDPEKPRMQAWIPERVPPKNPPWKYVRNPYFWAVDEEGNQLPYIDGFETTKVEHEVWNLRALSGELDFAQLDEFGLMPEFKKRQKSGEANYRTAIWSFPVETTHRINFNHTSEDPVLRDIFNDIRFKKAISYAINRQEINDLLYFNMLEPFQFLPPTGSGVREDLAEEGLGKKYIEYNPEKARELLNEIGLDEKNSDDWRLRPDSEELLLSLTTYGDRWTDAAELVADHLRKVGINAKVKLIDISLFGSRVNNNEIDVTFIGGKVTDPILINEYNFTPITSSNYYAPNYGLWYESDGEEGTKPEGDFMKNIERYKKLLVEDDQEEQLKLQKEIVRTAVNNLWTIGTLDKYPTITIINNKLKNLPEGDQTLSWNNIMGDIFRPETYFFEE